MADQTPQSYTNHARYVPAFHFVLAAMLVINLVYTVVHLWRMRTIGAAVGLMMAFAWILLYLYARAFPVTVQDRVIRLEETLRYQRLLPADLQARIGELSRRQIIGLRFASDGELPGLVRKALDEKLSEKAIKQSVQNWRADHLRA
jgi:hypothetical protein